MQESRGLVALSGPVFAPHVPGKGVPIIKLHADPTGRTLRCAFSSRVLCEMAIAKWFSGLGAAVQVVDDPSSMIEEASRRGYTVALDLEDDGERWHYSEFEPALLAPDGDC